MSISLLNLKLQDGPTGLRQRLKRRLAEYVYLRQNFSSVPSSDCSKARTHNQLDLVTVAFNNPTVISHQIRLLKQNLKDDFSYTVGDNSSQAEARQDIQKICQREGIGYISLPPNPYVNPSSSHGLAINWLYRNYLVPRGAEYFGILDHDIFPAKPTELVKLIKPAGVYGRKQTREDKWYLWPGFTFFSRDFVAGRPLNFLPGDGLDTGGSNWARIYSKLPAETIKDLPTKYQSLSGGKDPQRDLVEYFGDWLHTINASSWKPAEGKDSLVAKLLESL